MKTIAILRDRAGRPMGHTIDHLALRWKDAGHQVIDHIGPSQVPDADVYIVHIDLTVVPEEYVDLIRALPNAINGQILDISRRKFSRLILSKEDDYDGPVIIKTNANFGGVPEYNLSSEKHYLTLNWWATTKYVNPLKYPVRENISKVPKGVWKNENLIVEPFIMSREGDLYYVRYYVFFGDKEYSGRIGSTNRIVKFKNSVVDEEIPLPDEVRQWRKDLKIDFGRLDYLERDGQYYLIDVNKTEGGSKINTEYSEEMDYLASGLDCFLK
ncbi:MAG: hypothetical protein P8M07_06510 [Flavobacteriales bacterium]|nr:hypothetical protein [Flavobacteriales bacterium]